LNNLQQWNFSLEGNVFSTTDISEVTLPCNIQYSVQKTEVLQRFVAAK